MCMSMSMSIHMLIHIRICMRMLMEKRMRKSLWQHLSFAANTIYPFFEALLEGELDELPSLDHLLLWQACVGMGMHVQKRRACP